VQKADLNPGPDAAGGARQESRLRLGRRKGVKIPRTYEGIASGLTVHTLCWLRPVPSGPFCEIRRHHGELITHLIQQTTIILAVKLDHCGLNDPGWEPIVYPAF
jgi:hypothetical protein